MRFSDSLVKSAIALGVITILSITGCGKKDSDDESVAPVPPPKVDTSLSDGNKDGGTSDTNKDYEAPLSGTWTTGRKVALVPDPQGNMVESGSEFRLTFSKGMVKHEMTYISFGSTTTAEVTVGVKVTATEVIYLGTKTASSPVGALPCTIGINEEKCAYTLAGDKLTLKKSEHEATEYTRVK